MEEINTPDDRDQILFDLAVLMYEFFLPEAVPMWSELYILNYDYNLAEQLRLNVVVNLFVIVLALHGQPINITSSNIICSLKKIVGSAAHDGHDAAFEEYLIINDHYYISRCC